MGNITDKLNYLQNTKEAIRTSLIGQGQEVTAEDTFRSYAAKTAAISSPPVTEKDVNFYDYDGTLLYSYTAEDFLALSVMPVCAKHTGLTSQGWNWTLTDAKTFVTENGFLDIGNAFITNDDDNRIYITLPEGYLTPHLGVAISGTVIIDWGDGTSETVTGSSTSTRKDFPHTYSAPGNYVIKLRQGGSNYNYGFVGYDAGSYILWSGDTNDEATTDVYRKCIKKIELGDFNEQINDSGLKNLTALETIVISEWVKYLYQYMLQNCTSLKALVWSKEVKANYRVAPDCTGLEVVCIPKLVGSIGEYAYRYSAIKSATIDATSIGEDAFYECKSLKRVAISSRCTTIGRHAFQNCTSLSRISLNEGVITINNEAFSGCKNIQLTSIPSTVTTIGDGAFIMCNSLVNITVNATTITNSAFYNCSSLTSVVLPNVTSIDAGGFGLCPQLAKLDMSGVSAIPTLANSQNCITNNTNLQIIVPDELYDDWIVATNWSTYADKIVKASEA